MQAKLKTYYLSVSGNRADLLDRLKRFARDRTGWYNIFRPQVNRQRGQMTGKRAQTQIAHRMESQFPRQDAVEGFLPRNGKSTRPIRPLPGTEFAKFEEWVHNSPTIDERMLIRLALRVKAAKVLQMSGDIPGPETPGPGMPEPEKTIESGPSDGIKTVRT